MQGGGRAEVGFVSTGVYFRTFRPLSRTLWTPMLETFPTNELILCFRRVNNLEIFR